MEKERMSFLQSILQFSTENTNVTEPSRPVVQQELDDERKEFLSNVLSQTTFNPLDEMKKCMRALVDSTQDVERHYEALETLKDWCDDLNFSNDFHKLNGYAILPDLLNHQNNKLRALACEFVGVLAQNNEYGQKMLINDGFLKTLLDKLNTDLDESVKIKSLYAVSCMVREYFDGQEKLLDLNGVEVLVKVIELPIEKLQNKCCFLISSICSNLEIKAEFTKQFLIQKLIRIYNETEFHIHEHVLAAIIALIDNNPEAIKQAKHMNLDFKNIISRRLSLVENDPGSLEEKEHATYLLECLFKN